MILIDTSAWIEFLRGTGTATCSRVRELVVSGFATAHPIRMEVLAGARNADHLDQLRRLLGRGELLPARDTDFEDAATIYRACRVHGETVRRMIDCLIAAIAIREGVSLLQADRDFVAIARHTALALDVPA